MGMDELLLLLILFMVCLLVLLAVLVIRISSRENEYKVWHAYRDIHVSNGVDVVNGQHGSGKGSIFHGVVLKGTFVVEQKMPKSFLAFYLPSRNCHSRLPLDARGVLFGREPWEYSPSYPDTLFPEDLMVSRQHCTVYAREGSLYIRDERSTYKTFVNGRAIEKDTLLHPGDRIQIGKTEFIIEE